MQLLLLIIIQTHNANAWTDQQGHMVERIPFLASMRQALKTAPSCLCRLCGQPAPPAPGFSSPQKVQNHWTADLASIRISLAFMSHCGKQPHSLINLKKLRV